MRFYLSQASLMLSKLPSQVVGEPLEKDRLCDAVNVLLSLQVSLLEHIINIFSIMFYALITSLILLMY